MAEEFMSFLNEAKKEPFEERLTAFGDIIEKIMTIVLKSTDLTDGSLQQISSKISSLESRINSMNSDIATLKVRPGGSPGGPPGGLPPGGPPGDLPPPPGGPPGGLPPPPGGSGPARPANPVSLRGAIMGELKSLFAKRGKK